MPGEGQPATYRCHLFPRYFLCFQCRSKINAHLSGHPWCRAPKVLPGVEPLDSTHDNMMMLWSVWAVAGPRTGDGDVSAISPTVDDGAGSMMFRFGPTRVAGFDFEFGSTTMIFSTSLNSTGACQPVPSISHDVLAAISGLNNNQKDYCRDCCLSNYQEEQETGRWRWIMPSIVTVVLLGDLSTRVGVSLPGKTNTHVRSAPAN